MAWNMLDNITNTGNAQTDLVNTLTAPARNFSPLWAIIILLPLFIILTTRTFFRHKASTDREDLWGSMAVSAFFTILSGLLMSLAQLINNDIFSWIVGLGIVLMIIFLLLKE